MKGPNTEFRKQELTQAVENAQKAVTDAELTAQEEEQEVMQLEQELREAELTAQRQEEAEEEGEAMEKQINEVTA
jgi:hypothetical protein